MSGRSVAVLAVVGIGGFLYCAAPSCIHKARLYAPETAALRAVQTLNAAQVQYNSQFGRYARSLIELGPSAADLISADFAVGEKARLQIHAEEHADRLHDYGGAIGILGLAHVLLGPIAGHPRERSAPSRPPLGSKEVGR
jgi:hypothetical protein